MSDRQPIGYFTFVLHSHLPYVRRAGRWPHGEEMIHEALAETYLPLMRRDSTIYGQLKVGRETSRRHMEGRPHGVWLPECAYRPAYLAEDGHYKPGIEEFLAELNLLYFLTETHVVAGGKPVGKV